MSYDETLSSNQLPIKIRPIGKEELEEALGLIHQSIRVLNARDYKPTQIESVIQTYKISTLREKGVIVAEYHDKIVGVAKLSGRTVQAVFTHPQFVRKGVGKALVKELERRARSRNAQDLSLMASITAVEFYEALGYKNSGKLKGNIPCICMEKKFRPADITERVVGIGILIFLTAVVMSIAFLIVAPIFLYFFRP